MQPIIQNVLQRESTHLTKTHIVSPVYPTVQTRQAKSNTSIVAVAAVYALALCHQAQPHLRNRLLILDTNTHWDQWGHVLYFALLRSYISCFNKYSHLCNTSEYSNKVLSKRERVSTGLFDCQKDTDPPSNRLPAVGGRGGVLGGDFLRSACATGPNTG